MSKLAAVEHTKAVKSERRRHPQVGRKCRNAHPRQDPEMSQQLLEGGKRRSHEASRTTRDRRGGVCRRRAGAKWDIEPSKICALQEVWELILAIEGRGVEQLPQSIRSSSTAPSRGLEIDDRLRTSC